MTTTAAPQREVVIGRPMLSRTGDSWHVEADVDGTPAWFESADAKLAPHVEAFASAFLGPALANGRTLRVNGPVSAAWLQNVANIPAIWKKWWGYDVPDPIRADDVCDTPAPEAPPGFTASCFSGGVDSSWTLLRSANAPRIQRLFFVHGFDIPLADQTRMNAWEPALCRVAAETGRPAIVLRTNLRLHPLFRHSNWERTHGGALAAAGHVVAGMGRLLIPATYTLDHEVPWGSHFLTDHFWSRPGFEVEHDDAKWHRREKLRAIADEPLVWETLRVCWEGRTPTGNCSMCEKCVRTMLILHMCGRLDKFRVFDRSVPLAQRVLDLKWLPPHLFFVYEGLLKDGLDGEEGAVVRRMLAEGRPPGLVRRVARKAKRVVARILGRPAATSSGPLPPSVSRPAPPVQP
jgi:hypothetical protein